MFKLAHYLTLLTLHNLYQAALTCDSNVTIEGTQNVEEGTGHVTVSLKRTGDLSQSASVRVSSSDASAQSPEDFIAVTNASVLFAVNKSSASFNVTIINDNRVESLNETFSLRFESSNSSSICVNISPLNVMIKDDDEVTIEFSSTNVTVQEDKKSVSLQIIKIGTAVIPVQVRINMAARNFETADKNVDYVDRHNAIITFQANDKNKSLAVEIKDDNMAESTEVFAASLEAVNPNTTAIGSKSMAIILIEDKADQDFQATTQKQKEEDQEKRVKQVLILLIVCTAISGVLIAVVFIMICLVIRWRKNKFM